MPLNPGLWPPGPTATHGLCRYRDGRADILATSDAITVDTMAPEGSFTINGDDPYTDLLS